MDSADYEIIEPLSFYGLPRKQVVLFQDLLEAEESDKDVDSGIPSTSRIQNDDNSSEDELEDLLVEFEDEAQSDIEQDQNNGNLFLEEYENKEWLSEDEMTLQQVKDSIRNQTWIAIDNERGPATIPQFSGISKINANTNSVIDIFFSLISDDMMEDIVYQTNLYSQRDGKEYINLTNKELYVFIGINIVMSYIRYPRVRLYWSSEDGLRMDLISDAMSVNRYETILRNLHFVENPVVIDSKSKNVRTRSSDVSKSNDEDKLWKLRPFLNKLQTNFVSAMDPEEYQSVDEQVIPMKSRISIKQYLPKKPKKWGIKCWVRAGTSGYIYRFEIYQGAKKRMPVGPLGACADVVLRLCDDIHQKNHKVVFDNLFCSIGLLDTLRNNGNITCR